MASKKVILHNGTSSYYGWSQDIGSINMPPLYHFHHVFYYSIMTLNYQPPFNVMLW
jgi:hypothetical protein